MQVMSISLMFMITLLQGDAPQAAFVLALSKLIPAALEMHMQPALFPATAIRGHVSSILDSMYPQGVPPELCMGLTARSFQAAASWLLQVPSAEQVRSSVISFYRLACVGYSVTMSARGKVTKPADQSWQLPCSCCLAVSGPTAE